MDTGNSGNRESAAGAESIFRGTKRVNKSPYMYTAALTVYGLTICIIYAPYMGTSCSLGMGKRRPERLVCFSVLYSDGEINYLG